MPIIAISGYFDPLHGGHIDYIRDASTYGGVLVILNTDAAAIRKKGYVFMEWHERKKILESITDVIGVVQAYDQDGTVCKNLERLDGMIDYFGKGGDRTKSNTPETAICNRLDIPVIFGLGGNKTQSSSVLVKNVQTC